MAYTPNTPIQKNITLVPAVAQSIGFAFLTAAGAPLDVHAWHTVTLDITFNVNGPARGLEQTELIAGSTASFTTPITSFLLTAAEANTAINFLPPGQYGYTMVGVPVTADDPQLLASGSCTVASTP